MLLGHGMKIRVREIFDLMGLALRLQYMFLMIDICSNAGRPVSR